MKKFAVCLIIVFACFVLLSGCTFPAAVKKAVSTKEPVNSIFPEHTAAPVESVASPTPDIPKPSTYTVPLQTSKPIAEENGKAGRGQVFLDKIDSGGSGYYLVHFTQEGGGPLYAWAYELDLIESLDNMHDAYGMIYMPEDWDYPEYMDSIHYDASGDWTLSVVKAETTTEDTDFYGNGSLITPVFNVAKGFTDWRFIHQGAGKFIVYYVSEGEENYCNSKCVVNATGDFDKIVETQARDKRGLFVIDTEGEWEIIKQ